MTDLMPIFTQCVNIVEAELGVAQKPTRKHPQDTPTIHDTFIKESQELYYTLVVLKQFLVEVKPEYLAVNSDGAGSTSASSNALTIEDKNKIDEELNYRFQQLYEKLKLLQAYEAKRELVRAKNAGGSKGWFDSVFGDGPSETQTYEEAVNYHRTQILRFLNTCIKTVGKEFEVLQRKRSQREKQLNLLNFQDLQDYEDEDDIPAVQLRRLSVMELEHDSIPLEDLDAIDYDNTQQLQHLSAEQIQEFETENKQFLTLKTNQLKQVERLHSSMVDIMNLQSEITFQLDTQAEKVSSIMDAQDDIQIDLTQGNKNLTKASVKNKRGADMLVSFCVIMGILILLVDYLSW